MEATPSIAQRLFFPAAAYPTEWPEEKRGRQSHGTEPSWNNSRLNPSNRVESLDAVLNPRWRIDGCTGLGTQFFTIPLFFKNGLHNRIDTFTPEHSDFPFCLRQVLDLSTAFSTCGPRVAQLGVSRYILRALEHWTGVFPQLEDTYNSLPFGSRIVLENLSVDINQIRIRFVAAHYLERQLLSQNDLTALWDFRPSWPPSIDLSCLELMFQIHDSISLARRLDIPDNTPIIFKALVMDPKYLYHELKTIFILPPHPNIISRPLNLVTKRCRFGNKTVIVGFTMVYHIKGSLSARVLQMRAEKETTTSQKAKWAAQLTQALSHIVENGGFYSDLRLDNVVLSATDDIILIDHEQRGASYVFSPPEVNYLDYLHTLAFSDEIPISIKDHYREMVQPYLQSSSFYEEIYQNPESGYNFPWSNLDAAEKESATVYLLGLTLWCLFEGVAAPEPVFWKSETGESTFTPTFPEFKVTPVSLRNIIKKCIQGTLRHDQRFPILRKGKYFVLRQEYYEPTLNMDGEHNLAHMEEFKKVSQKWWSKELTSMETYLVHLTVRKTNDGKLQSEHLFARPNLKEVLQAIETMEWLSL